MIAKLEGFLFYLRVLFFFSVHVRRGSGYGYEVELDRIAR